MSHIKFRQAIEKNIAACDPDSSIAIVTVKIHELHRLKTLYGYDEVDYLVGHAMASLKESLKKCSFIIRLTDSTLGLIFSGLRFPHLARVGLERILQTLKIPILFDDQEVVLLSSASAAIYPSDGVNPDQLLLGAEFALMSTNPLSRPVLLYEELVSNDGVRQQLLEADLKSALASNNLSVNYQPKIWLRDSSLASFEALLRWNHPDHGPISPALFVPIAESKGMINSMTEWVLHTALRETKGLIDAGMADSVAINISASSLTDPCFLFAVDSAVSMWAGGSYENLTLEITESVLMEDFDVKRPMFEELKSKGVHISIDDFGTGYSSLSYFKHLPVNEVKIDRSFITGMKDCENDRRIVEVILDLAHKFDLTVVAEGIENRATFDLLRDMGCDIAQGFFISKALAYDELSTWSVPNPLEDRSGEDLQPEITVPKFELEKL